MAGVQVRQWSELEDECLTRGVAKYGEIEQWKAIAAEFVPGRTNKACRKRWLHSLSPTVKKTPWTTDEDQVLLSMHAVHGERWAVIARCIPGRTDDACAKRFREALDPTLRKEAWTNGEDQLLRDLFASLQGKWSRIGQQMGRSGLGCRNRWRLLERRRLAAEKAPEQTQAMDDPSSTGLPWLDDLSWTHVVDPDILMDDPMMFQEDQIPQTQFSQNHELDPSLMEMPPSVHQGPTGQPGEIDVDSHPPLVQESAESHVSLSPSDAGIAGCSYEVNWQPTQPESQVPNEAENKAHRLSSTRAVVEDFSILPYACGACWVQESQSSTSCFATSQELSVHCRDCRGEAASADAKLFRCALPRCGKAWKSINGLQYHLQVSKAHYQVAISKASCAAKSSSRDNESASDHPKKYPCRHEGCTNSYKQLSGLRYHLTHGHPTTLPEQLNSLPPSLATKFQNIRE